jgi:hypothetical protein
MFDDASGLFGLMYQDGTPTPAGTALHNLCTLLSDGGTTASNAGAGTNMINNGAGYLMAMPGAGLAAIHGCVVQNGAKFDFITALKAAAWNGGTSVLGQFPHVATSGNDAIVPIRPR